MSETYRGHRGTMLTVGKTGLVVLLSVFLAGLAFDLVRGGSVATAQSPVAAQAAGLFVAPGQITSDTYGVYLVDPQTNMLAVYQWLPGNPGKLKLIATRNCTFDLQLDEYNTEPSPGEIRQLVREGVSLSGLAR